MKPVYKGEALDLNGLFTMLESQGLAIEDKQRALQILSNVSYSRLKSYLVPLMESRTPHRFIPGSSIEQAYALYGFDRRLRELIFHEMEKVEISIRTRMSLATSGEEVGYWFLNPEHFRNRSEHNYILRKIKNDVDHSDEDSIKSFKAKFSNEFPPSWITLEATSMGTLSYIYDNMASGPLKTAISSYYGLPENEFGAWLRHIVYVRNICAHHARLWNKNIKIPAPAPQHCRHHFPEYGPDSEHRVYGTLCIVKYLQDTIKPTNSFAYRLKTLLDAFPIIRAKQYEAMGFPKEWREDPLWK